VIKVNIHQIIWSAKQKINYKYLHKMKCQKKRCTHDDRKRNLIGQREDIGLEKTGNQNENNSQTA
jgi:hypothetical protein